MRLALSTLVASFVAELASANPSNQPVATRVVENVYDPYGWSPNPTEAPSLELLRKRVPGLDKRQAGLSSGQLVGYFAPDSMCGYISGSIGASLPCSSASRCAAIAPIGQQPGAVGCCPVGSSGCYFITTCYNSADIAASKCDHGCQQDADVRLCTATSAPYCYGYTWPGISATIWGCASTSPSTMDTVLFTYLGETDSRSWSAYFYTPSGSDSGSNGGILTVSRSSSGGSSSSSSASSSSSSGGGGSGGGGSGGSSSHTGAIVGGVIGGLAVLGAVVLGVVFLLMRRKKHNNAAAAQPGHTAGGAPPVGGMPGQSPHHMSGVPAAAAAGGYYGHEHKPSVSEMGSPGNGYMQPYKDPNNPYDHRVSHFSEAGSPVPPYGPPMHMQQGPTELDATSSAQGRPVYEAPAHVPPHASPSGAMHPPA